MLPAECLFESRAWLGWRWFCSHTTLSCDFGSCGAVLENTQVLLRFKQDYCLVSLFLVFWNETLRLVSLLGNTVQVWALPAGGSDKECRLSAVCVGGGGCLRDEPLQTEFLLFPGRMAPLSASGLHGSPEGRPQLPGNVASPAGQAVSGRSVGQRGRGADGAGQGRCSHQRRAGPPTQTRAAWRCIQAFPPAWPAPPQPPLCVDGAAAGVGRT